MWWKLEGRIPCLWNSGKSRNTFTKGAMKNGTTLMVQIVKNLPAMRKAWVPSLGWEDPGRRKWQPTPVFLPGEPHGQRSLAGYSPWDCKRVWATDTLHEKWEMYLRNSWSSKSSRQNVQDILDSSSCPWEIQEEKDELNKELLIIKEPRLGVQKIKLFLSLIFSGWLTRLKLKYVIYI